MFPSALEPKAIEKAKDQFKNINKHFDDLNACLDVIEECLEDIVEHFDNVITSFEVMLEVVEKRSLSCACTARIATPSVEGSLDEDEDDVGRAQDASDQKDVNKDSRDKKASGESNHFCTCNMLQMLVLSPSAMTSQTSLDSCRASLVHGPSWMVSRSLSP